MLRALIFAAGMVLPLANVGAQTPNPIDCSHATSTMEMNECADRDFAAADRVLNETYQKALAMIGRDDGSPAYTAAEWEKQFRASQRAWVAFRDADCNGLVPVEWSGGSITSYQVLSCMIELTKARTQMLRERYDRQ